MKSNTNKITAYSIQDAFKSLDMLEDEEVMIVEEATPAKKILSENVDTSVESEESEGLTEEQILDIDAEIEEFTNKLRKLKEKYDKNPKSLSSSEFKQLKESGLIEQEESSENINEEQKVNIGDKQQVQQELDELNKEVTEEEVEMVVDVEAGTVEDLKDSYVGSFILQCPVCKTLVYKDEHEVVHSEEDEDIVNVEESCPHCKSEEGFVIVGKVAPIEDEVKSTDDEETEEDAEKETEEETETEDQDNVNTEEDEEEDVQTESLTLEAPQFDIDDLNEELFNRLATKYLNNIYENVDNFITESGEVEEDTNKVTLEGTINFKSGKKLATKFVFEAKALTKKGRVRLIGMNENLSSSKKTFVLVGRIVDKVLMAESLTYNYSVKVNEELKRIYGRVTEDLSKFNK